ncbi:homoserine O-acetyltransferase [Acidiferrimicrobium sp. IK]|uniref:homoserine O-acetyltransferase MetX n=1 Tax=Acidiferrimicrobium sp. IK TaxID=2871700 RepID=UPI003967779F|nr:homoserine O-acetyltransferase [Acidiferrimicrobium sp. IK]
MPASGAWQPGDPEGRRRWATVFADSPLCLEAGATLGPVTVAYETWGTLRPDGSNAVLVLHALTGDSHLAGPVEAGHPSPGWWEAIVAPGGALDPADWFVVCPNVLGGCQGTTGPASLATGGRRYASAWPTLTIRDQVAVEVALADFLGIDRWAAVVGGSMGGMRVLEWAVGAPERLERAVVVACGPVATAEQIAWCAVQAQAIRLDPGFAGGDYYDAPPGAGPARGMGTARRIGHITYRCEPELDARFGHDAQDGEAPLAGGRFAVESYLDHQALKLAARFDANSYLSLSRAMDLHDVGRDRGGVAAALARVTAKVTVAGVDSDRLYPLRLQEQLAAALPGGPPLQIITSAAGHDGFLVEADQVDKVVAGALQW